MENVVDKVCELRNITADTLDQIDVLRQKLDEDKERRRHHHNDIVQILHNVRAKKEEMEQHAMVREEEIRYLIAQVREADQTKQKAEAELMKLQRQMLIDMAMNVEFQE